MNGLPSVLQTLSPLKGVPPASCLSAHLGLHQISQDRIVGAWLLRRKKPLALSPSKKPDRPSSIVASSSLPRPSASAPARPSRSAMRSRNGSPGKHVTSPRARRPSPSQSIFINCPFDDGYRPILRAIVFTVIASGYNPRSALDATDGAEVRVTKIAQMIGECDWGIHDISRIEVPTGEMPRFNMPMELGIHLGARLLGEGRHRRKRALILEASRHRYDQVVSDISGQDIEAHGNDPDRAIGCIRNWLSEHRHPNSPPLPGVAAMQTDYQLFQQEIGAVLQAKRLDPFDQLSHSDFLWAVRDWIDSRVTAA